MRRQWLGTLAVAVLILSGLGLPSAGAAVPSPGTAADTPAKPNDAWRSGATGSDDDVSAAPDAPRRGRLEQSLDRLQRTGSSATVTVEIRGDDSTIADAVRRAGGTLGNGGGGLYLADVPATSLATIAGQAGISSVDPPQKVFTRKTQIERGSNFGDWDAAAGNWRAQGFTGAGVKVGIVGLFDSALLDAQVVALELLTVPNSNRYCVSNGVLCPFGTPGQKWGNALAEIVSDGAPDAELFLAELGYRGDYYPVIDWMAANGVRILLNPINWSYDGPGNGTGPSAAIVDYAVSKGITWVNTAGELAPVRGYSWYAGGYWRGTWNDPDNDRWLNFSGTDESLSVYCGYLLGARWSDWSGIPTDYDLYISDYNISTRGNGTKKVLSARVQSAGVTPLEGTSGVALCNTNPANGPVYDTNKDGFVSLWFQRKSTSSKSSATGDVIEIAVEFGWLEHFVEAGSVALPFADSANPGAVTVTLEWPLNDYPAGGVGPTNDGRRKPELAAAACSPTYAAGMTCYYGSDGSAALVASRAALADQAFRFNSPRNMLLYLRDNAGRAAIELPWGVAALPMYPPPSQYALMHLKPEPAPVRLIDTRYGIGVSAIRPLAANETIRLTGPEAQSTGAWVLNVAIVNATAPGWLSIYPAGHSYPNATSAINADAGQNRANLIIVPAGQYGDVDIHSSAGGHVIVDLVGRFVGEYPLGEAKADGGSGRYHALDPFRLVDTRHCTGIPACTGQKVDGGSFLDIDLAGASDPADPLNAVPDDAIAVALSVTIDDPAAKGYASVIPGGTSAITTSNLNFDGGKSVTTLVLATLPTAAAGMSRVFTSQAAHVQVDVLGWFTPVTGIVEREGTFQPTKPVRTLDTRTVAGGLVPADGVVTIDTALFGAPADATAVFANNVSVGSTATGEVTVDAPPLHDGHPTRNLTISAVGRPVAAGTLTALTDGDYSLRPSAPTHLVSDVAGWFVGREFEPLTGDVFTPVLAPDGSPATGKVLQMTPDGAFALIFSTQEGLDPTPTGTDYFRWEAATGEFVELPHRPAVVNPMSRDGSAVLVATYEALTPDDTLLYRFEHYIYDIENDTYQYTGIQAGYGTEVVFTEDGTELICGTQHEVLRFDRATAVLTQVPNSRSISGQKWVGPNPSHYLAQVPGANGWMRLVRIPMGSSTPDAFAPDGFRYNHVYFDGWAGMADSGGTSINIVDFSTSTSVKYEVTLPGGSPVPVHTWAAASDGHVVYAVIGGRGSIWRIDTAAETMTEIHLSADGRATDGRITSMRMNGTGTTALAMVDSTTMTPYGEKGLYLMDLTALP